ncbi:type IV leader peptidase family protein [Pseudonocardia sediminis]|uniref:Type IV leader peptidase family protein n=1 Tax=Pseudonocardia sediminis TaxID=1397368 RepID=A0A4Q7UUV7_PSEST|nr:prepilin peptidase [Pseudonocardia sediminis]RZT85556.1 type IV leader peptidase family protein [Pseudonocardia sediminis]
MTAELTAVLAAVTLGPFTLLAVRRTMHSLWLPGRAETAAIVALAGITPALATHDTRALMTLLPLTLLGPAAALVDAREARLPDSLTAPLLGASLLMAAFSGPAGTRAVALATVVSGLAVVLAVLSTDLLGWGDVKLIPSLAIALAQVDALLSGLFRIVTLVALTAALVGFRYRRAVVPYGPALVIGTLSVGVGL